jgi:hypothetical protein
VNKRVSVKGKKESATIVEYDEVKGLAVLKYDGQEIKKRKTIAASKLNAVLLMPDQIIQPTYVSQRVVVVSGTNPAIIGSTGTIKMLAPHNCSIVLDGEGAVHSLSLKHVSALDPSRAVVVAPAPEPIKVHLDDFPNAIESYVQKGFCLVAKTETAVNFVMAAKASFLKFKTALSLYEQTKSTSIKKISTRTKK